MIEIRNRGVSRTPTLSTVAGITKPFSNEAMLRGGGVGKPKISAKTAAIFGSRGRTDNGRTDSKRRSIDTSVCNRIVAPIDGVLSAIRKREQLRPQFRQRFARLN